MGRPIARAPRVVGDDTVRDDADADGDAPSARARHARFTRRLHARAWGGWSIATRRDARGKAQRVV